MRPTLTSSTAPPRAHGASTSTSASSAVLGSAQRAPASSLASDRRRSSMSASVSLAPAAREPPRELGPHSPHSHHGHGAAAQVGRAEAPLAAGPHGGLHPLGGERAGVTAAALGTRQAGHVGRAAGQDGHVAGARAHVLGRHVAAVQRVHGVGEVQQHVAPTGACRRRAGLGADHALATAERHARGGRLEGHGARQAKRVPRAVRRALIAPHPAAAQGRPQRRGVHGDHGVHAGPPAPADHELLVVQADQRSGVAVVAHEGILPQLLESQGVLRSAKWPAWAAKRRIT